MQAVYIPSQNTIAVVRESGKDSNGNKWYRTNEGVQDDCHLVFLSGFHDVQKYIDSGAHIAPSTLQSLRFKSVRVIFANSDHNYETSVNSAVENAEIRRYFVGKFFDVGSYPIENLQKCIGVDIN